MTRIDGGDAVLARILDGFDLSPYADRNMLVEGATQVAAAIATEEGLTEEGAEIIVRYLRGHLDRLVQIRTDRARHPEIAQVRIEQPLVITGAPRGGTTFLHSLLAEDPTNRAPLGWECAFPSPPPEAAAYDSDPRIARWIAQSAGPEAEAYHDASQDEIGSKHKTGATQPEECGYFLTSSMRGNDVWAMLRGTGYMHWMLDTDMVPAIEIHREWLQQLQWRNARTRWVLKNPPYAYHLGPLHKVYPDMCLVVNHRDPVAVVSSLASLIESYRKTTYAHVDRHALGLEVLHYVGLYLSRPLAWRRANPDVPVFDVSYSKLIADPLDIARRIYDFFGLPLTAKGADAMRAYVDNNPQGKHGAHKHHLADYGLTPDIVREKLADYVAAHQEHF